MAKEKRKVISDKHRRVADLYLSNGSNVVAAYMEVYGCARSTASNAGYKFLKRPEVAEYIEKQNAKISDKHILSKEQVLEELSEIAVNPKTSWMQRVQALKYVGDYHQAFVQKKEIELTSIDVVVEGLDVEILDDDLDEDLD